MQYVPLPVVAGYLGYVGYFCVAASAALACNVEVAPEPRYSSQKGALAGVCVLHTSSTVVVGMSWMASYAMGYVGCFCVAASAALACNVEV